MEMPTVETIFKDGDRNITFILVGYRTITRGEAITLIRLRMAGKRRKLKAGSTIRIVTVIGADD